VVDLALVRFVPPFRTAETALQDLLYIVAYPRSAISDDVVIVAVTEDTLATLPYRSPVDRAFLGDLIEAISAAGPRGIALDFVFDRATEPEKDARLMAALEAKRDHPIVAAHGTQEVGFTPKQVAFLETFLADVRKGLAILLANPDDGVVRAVKPFTETGEGVIPSLALAVTGRGPGDLSPAGERIAFQFPEDLTERRFPTYPAELVSRLPPAWFSGRYVLIGADLPNQDRYASPLATLLGRDRGELPGVAFHAQFLQQLLDGRQLVPLQLVSEAGIALIMAMASALAMSMRLGVAWRCGLVVAALLVLWTGAAVALRQSGVLVPVLAPTIAAALAGSSIGVAQWLAERRQRRFIRDAFNRYVAPAVVEQIVADPWRMRVGAERRQASCIFTDVAGFTSLSETLPADLLADLLNRYLSGMTDLFFAHEATLDKFVGDAVVGFFGGPLPREDHARAALRLAGALDAFGRDFAEEVATRHEIRFGVTRIGVHSGEVLIGNFGGDRFFDYTAIGDTVNIAARLESANKHFGTRVCISGDTLAAAPEARTRPIGRIVLKGKRRDLEVHQLIGADADPCAAADYAAAYALLERDRDRAAEAFHRLEMSHPDDPLVAFQVKRLQDGETGTRILMKEK